ncbi:FBP C-terminal treble-clef zinc-finger [Salinibacillus kushneri]|uniref:FBP C-terminal treble-clef zinc-finger n=1 Tax=Salinibacillus kushneri TaxID=237682 RepID=A0A1I0A8U9_9BACI|nr:FusB/FusC family EF-G-binding protein [Salinibacillus kushneri]SES90595.1 FBP C-terminal treble-clef zinc-finger [Salinibacillus kushneri]
MNAFIRVYQFNYIKGQVQNLVNGHSTAKDESVLNTIKSMAIERVSALFPNMNEEQKQLFQPITSIDDKEKAERFIDQLKPYVIPFNVTEQGIKKLFPKVKKLKIPALEDIDLREISYFSWVDYSANKKYIVIRRDKKLIGLQGSFTTSNQKGICSICNSYEDVGMFLVKKKGNVQGNFIKRGNYICQDSKTCNHNLMSLDKLYEFVERLNG